MSKRIYKYELGPTTTNIPADARVLHIAGQGGAVMLWAETDPACTDTREVICVMTGAKRPAHRDHIGTVLLNYGALVLHFYTDPPR